MFSLAFEHSAKLCPFYFYAWGKLAPHPNYASSVPFSRNPLSLAKKEKHVVLLITEGEMNQDVWDSESLLVNYILDTSQAAYKYPEQLYLGTILCKELVKSSQYY